MPPAPEETITRVLTGDTLQNALDFVALLRANNLQIEYNPGEYKENKYTGAIGGVVGGQYRIYVHPPRHSFPRPVEHLA